MSQGKTAMWYDDTVFTTCILQLANPEVKDNLAFAMAPVGPSNGPPPAGSGRGASASPRAASTPTRRAIHLLGDEQGLPVEPAGQKATRDSIPPGSRTSTYAIPEYQTAAKKSYADLTMASSTPPRRSRRPLRGTYTAVQYVQIPDSVDIGDTSRGADRRRHQRQHARPDALTASQDYAAKAVKDAGYVK